LKFEALNLEYNQFTLSNLEANQISTLGGLSIILPSKGSEWNVVVVEVHAFSP